MPLREIGGVSRLRLKRERGKRLHFERRQVLLKISRPGGDSNSIEENY